MPSPDQPDHVVSEPVTLVGSRVRLEPLSTAHVDALVAAASHDRSTYQMTVVPVSQGDMASYVKGLLAAQERGEVLPFAQVRLGGSTGQGAPDADQVVGCTRFMEPRWWSGRRRPDEIEIGGTWLAAGAQRTGINTEAKLLLLSYAFDVMDVRRVAIATDARNEQSRRAIERIGGTFEGVLRNHRPTANATTAQPRNTAMYSIIDTEWPEVKARLDELVNS